MKNTATVMFLILLPALAACNPRGTAQGKVQNNTDNSVEINDTDFVTLPNGALVEKGIPQDVADLMFRRFEAIENGDLASFRATLGDMQDGADINYQLHLIFTFFGDLFNIDSDAFNSAIADGGEELTEIRNTFFNSKPPLKSRNTGLSIQKLETVPGGGLKVTAKNNKNEEIIYFFQVPAFYP